MTDKESPYCVIPLHKPSLKELTFFFISGIVVSVPFALFFEQLPTLVFVSPALQTTISLVTVVLLAPLVEELAKVFPLFYRHGETERSIVILGLLLGLGFGVSEFFLYVFVGGVPFIVRLPGIIFHASSATIAAYGIAKKNPLPYYLIVVLLHVANNFFTEVPFVGVGVPIELLVLVVVYLLAWRFYHKTSEEKMVV